MANRKRFWFRSRRSRRSESSANGSRRLYRGLAIVGTVIAIWAIFPIVDYVYETEQLEIRHVQVRGERRVSESEILARVGYVPGSNALDVRLDEVRESIESLGWVRHATVQRVWPNELSISVVEREAVALVRIDGAIFQADADGVILPLDPSAPDRPVLDGLARPLTAEDADANAGKIDIYLGVLDELDAARLSEVHVAGTGEVSVVPIDDPVVVELGSRNHASRWERYQALRERIHADYPEATRIDLRFEDQVIIQLDEEGPADEIIWGEETKLL